MQQSVVVKADRELFTIMANEIKRSLRPLPTGILPMDEAMKQLRVDPRVTMHLLPLPKSKALGSDKRGNEDVVNPKSDPKLKAPRPKKPPTKKAAEMCPDELKGHHQRDESNENICWAFNLTNGCKTKAPVAQRVFTSVPSVCAQIMGLPLAGWQARRLHERRVQGQLEDIE